MGGNCRPPSFFLNRIRPIKTDPRVKSKTQREADIALSEMMMHNRGLKSKWTPKAPNIKVKKGRKKVKVKISLDIETLKVASVILMTFLTLVFVCYSFYYSFIVEHEVRLLPELDL